MRIGELNRIKDFRRDAGGKGINVSRVVKELGEKTKALGFIAGNNGRYIIDQLKNMGVDHDFNIVAGDTRTNLKVIDIVKGQETEINEPGPKITEDDLANLEEKLFSTVEEDDFVVLTGSLPIGVQDSFYAKMIKRLKEKGTRVILDASGISFELGIKENPYLIKPNLRELESLLDRKLKDREDIIKAAQDLNSRGIEVVVVSLGKEGSIVVSQGGKTKSYSPKG